MVLGTLGLGEDFRWFQRVSKGVPKGFQRLAREKASYWIMKSQFLELFFDSNIIENLIKMSKVDFEK